MSKTMAMDALKTRNAQLSRGAFECFKGYSSDYEMIAEGMARFKKVTHIVDTPSLFLMGIVCAIIKARHTFIVALHVSPGDFIITT